MGFNSELHIQIQEGLQNIANLVLEGELLHLDGLIEMRKHKQELEKSLETIKEFESIHLDAIARKAEEIGGKHKGFEISAVNGRKTYSFKGIPDWEKAEAEKKNVEAKFKSAFDAFQKNAIPTETVDGVLHWVDGDGQLNPFPEMSIGKSYLTVKPAK